MSFREAIQFSSSDNYQSKDDSMLYFDSVVKV